jgi:hypothetical protein
MNSPFDVPWAEMVDAIAMMALLLAVALIGAFVFMDVALFAHHGTPLAHVRRGRYGRRLRLPHLR